MGNTDFPFDRIPGFPLHRTPYGLIFPFGKEINVASRHEFSSPNWVLRDGFKCEITHFSRPRWKADSIIFQWMGILQPQYLAKFMWNISNGWEDISDSIPSIWQNFMDFWMGFLSSRIHLGIRWEFSKWMGHSKHIQEWECHSGECHRGDIFEVIFMGMA